MSIHSQYQVNEPKTGSTGVVQPSSEALFRLRESLLDTSYVSLGNRRTSTVHEFYRYPARFPPAFAAAAIEAFTDENGLVCDPFLGGGTTAVEALSLGRNTVGSDINELALFVSNAKTTLYSSESLLLVEDWAGLVSEQIRLNRPSEIATFWIENGYLRNMNSSAAWRLRNAIAHALSSLESLADPKAEMLARCAILRTGQVALDMRRHPLDVDTFREALSNNAKEMSATARQFAKDTATKEAPADVVLIKQALPGLGVNPQRPARPPSLILTSPPYPGVYVLYHRWKIRGRKESPAPYWIANALDGHGQTHYTMAARLDEQRYAYFERLEAAYLDLAGFTESGTWLVQVVGFNELPDQLNRYLRVMDDCGFEEVRFPEVATDDDGRLWREIPSRRWWVVANSRREVALNTSREVVLFHRRS
jgi:hypothetical protein